MMRFAIGKVPFTASMLADVRNFLMRTGIFQRNVLARTMVTDPSAAAGFRSNAARHQDFNTDADTQDSLVEMIK